MKASKKIFSLLLGTSMFFTGMPECFAMMADDGQNSTRPLSTDVPSEEAADGSSGPASPDMTDVYISSLFRDIVPSGGTTSSRPGTPVPLPSEGAGAVQPQIVEGVAAGAGTASSEHRSSTSSLADSAAREVESDGGASEGEPGSTPLSRSSSRSSNGGEMSDAGSSDDESGSSSAASSRSASSDTSSDEGKTFDGEREEEIVTFSTPLLPPGDPGIIAEAVRISEPGTEKSSFFAKTVDVAVVADQFLGRNDVTNFVSRVWSPTAGKCTVNGTKRKVKFDLIGSDDLSSLKNYRVIIYLLNSGFGQSHLAEGIFLRKIQPINSRASVIFVSVNSGTLAPDVVRYMSDRAAKLTTTDRKVAYATDADTNMNPTSGFLPFIVRLFDEADPNFSPLTPSQTTGAKCGGIAVAFVGGAWIAYKKISSKFKKPNQKKPEKQHKEDKNLSKTKSQRLVNILKK